MCGRAQEEAVALANFARRAIELDALNAGTTEWYVSN